MVLLNVKLSFVTVIKILVYKLVKKDKKYIQCAKYHKTINFFFLLINNI